MQINQDTNQSAYQIRSYEAGQLIVNQTTYTAPILLSADKLIEWPVAFDALTVDDWMPVLMQAPKILIVGTTTPLASVDYKVFQPLIKNQIGFEIMTPDAACRTFTIVTSESRSACMLIYP